MTDNWVDVCALAELGEGQRQIIEHEDRRILVTQQAGQLYALESLCPHAMFELDEAEIAEQQIICPLHGAHFCLKTGKVLSPPAYDDIPCFRTRTHQGRVQVLLPEEV